MIYKTFDYVRDNYPWIDSTLSRFTKFREVSIDAIKKMLNLEFDNYVFRIIENLPYGLIILFLGFFFVVGLIRATERENGLKVYNITTNSMVPEIKPGSLVFSYPQTRYHSGDIINYKENGQRTKTYTGRVLTHRIIDIREKEGFYIYTAKGDNNEHPDPGEIRTADITGAVILILPILGYVDLLIRTVPGFIIFILVPSLILLREGKNYLKS